MYHRDKYLLHNQSLARFCAVFNPAALLRGSRMVMDISQAENFRDDGKIIYLPTQQTILFDWEKRFSYYDDCDKFQFATFGQFERKIQKPEIALSIQCSTNECCFCIAWHDDFSKEPLVNIGSKMANNDKEYSGKRFTKHFREMSYQNVTLLCDILLKAFLTQQLNHTAFLKKT